MKMGIIKKIGKRYSVCVDGWSILPYFDSEEQADFACASRLGKLQKELIKIRVPFVKMWIAW
jgi:hypothetical protein